MGFRLSTIASSIRRGILLAISGIGGIGDYYWDKVVLAMSMDNSSDSSWASTSAALHMNEQDPYWSSTVLAMHMNDDPYWSNVVLAMHMDGNDNGITFTDVKGKTVTRGGEPVTKTTTKKFGTASAYFDGINDYLTLADSDDWYIGNTPYTIEFWVYFANEPAAGSFAGFVNQGGTDPATSSYNLYLNNGTRNLALRVSNGSTYSYYSFPNSTIPLNKWTHIAVCFDTANSTIYTCMDGVVKPNTFSGSIPNISGNLDIGRLSYASHYLNAYMDDLRITKGVARYTANFYPTQRAFAEGVPIDEKGKAITLVGNAALSTTQKKFGVSSLYLDGTGDYLTVPDSTDLNFGSGEFTLEFWVNLSSLPGASQTIGFVSKGGGGTSNLAYRIVYYNSAGVYYLFYQDSSVGTTLSVDFYTIVTLTTGTWHHIAITRDATGVRIFVNGALASTNSTVTAIYSSATTTNIGAEVSGISPLQGYIDDLRITKGVARYTSNFTPRPAAFLDPITAPTFLDEKGNIFLATGTPTLTATNAKFGGMSASFNGTTDYLRATDSLDFALAIGDFTIEAWVRTGASGTVIDLRKYSSDLGLFAISSGKASIWNRSAHLLGTTDLTTSTWFHLAWVRENGIVSLYVNGKVEAISITDGDFGIAARQCIIGADYAGANFFNGLIDDVRITKGYARYTGEFTPTNYSFLEPINKSMFVEETGKSVSAYGNVVTTTPLKYGNAAASFDGTGDYLSVPHSTDFDFGSGDFTIETWIYLDTTPTENKVFVNMRGLSGTTDQSYVFYYGYPSTCLALSYSSDGTTTVTCIGSQTVSIAAWHHVVAERDGSKIKLFLDGVEDTSVSNSSISVGLFTSSSPLTIGGNPGGTRSVDGSIDDLRITKGLARYLSNFTPPSKMETYQKTHNTDPYFNNVVLGMHMNGTDTGTSFPELTGKTVSVFGNAQTKTATKKFGTASAYFDGTGDYLSVTDATAFNPGNNDFTVEGWIYNTSVDVTNAKAIVGTRPNGIDGWILYKQPDGALNAAGFATPSTTVFSVSTDAISSNAWHHFAITRSSGVWRIFLNGTLGVSATVTETGNVGSTLVSGLTICRDLSNTNRDWNGYIDDLRITKGVARYTANFQPIQAPFPDFISPLDVKVSDPYWDNVVLAMHMDGADSGTTFTDVKGKTVTPVGSTQTKTAIKKFGTASAYFNGSSSYLSTPDSIDFEFGSSDFTIECWVYPTDLSVTRGIVSQRGGVTPNDYWGVRIESSIVRIYGAIGGSVIYSIFSTQELKINRWTHVAICRNSGITNIYLNGVGGVTGTQYSSFPSSGDLVTIGVDIPTNTNPFVGYIDDLRVTKGISRYTATATFQPPEVFSEKYPESDGFWSNTNLAMHFDGADSGTVFTDQKGLTVTRYGSIFTKTAQKKFGTASVQFTGNQADGFSVPASANWNYTASSFTIEFWLYPTAYNSNGSRLINSTGTQTGQWISEGINWFIGLSANGIFIQWWDGTAVRSLGGTISLNVWSHIAICGDGSTARLFINGTLIQSSGAGQYLATLAATPTMRIGSDAFASSTTYGTAGYMDDLQLIKGKCRYTSSFYVPTRAFNNG